MSSGVVDQIGCCSEPSMTALIGYTSNCSERQRWFGWPRRRVQRPTTSLSSRLSGERRGRRLARRADESFATTDRHDGDVVTIVGCFQALGQVAELRAPLEPRVVACLRARRSENTLEEAERRVEIRRDLLAVGAAAVSTVSRRRSKGVRPPASTRRSGPSTTLQPRRRRLRLQSSTRVASTSVGQRSHSQGSAVLASRRSPRRWPRLGTASLPTRSPPSTGMDTSLPTIAQLVCVQVVPPRSGIDIPAGPYDYTYPIRMSDHAQLSPGGRLGALVFLYREDVAARYSPRRRSGGALPTANMTLGATERERVMFRRLEHLVRTTPMFELRSQHVDDATSAVERLAERLHD